MTVMFCGEPTVCIRRSRPWKFESAAAIWCHSVPRRCAVTAAAAALYALCSPGMVSVNVQRFWLLCEMVTCCAACGALVVVGCCGVLLVCMCQSACGEKPSVSIPAGSRPAVTFVLCADSCEMRSEPVGGVLAANVLKDSMMSSREG